MGPSKMTAAIYARRSTGQSGDGNGDWILWGMTRECQDETLWTLTTAGSRALAIARKVPGVGVELRFLWNDDTRETKVYRNVVDLAAAANQKREELIGRGWRPDAASM